MKAKGTRYYKFQLHAALKELVPLLAALHSIIYLAGWRVEVEVGGNIHVGSGALRAIIRHIEAIEAAHTFLRLSPSSFQPPAFDYLLLL